MDSLARRTSQIAGLTMVLTCTVTGKAAVDVAETVMLPSEKRWGAIEGKIISCDRHSRLTGRVVAVPTAKEMPFHPLWSSHAEILVIVESVCEKAVLLKAAEYLPLKRTEINFALALSWTPNAAPPIVVTLSGIVTVVSPLSRNADAPIVVTFLPSVSFVSEGFLSNACAPIVLTPSGMTTSVNWFLKKAY